MERSKKNPTEYRKFWNTIRQQALAKRALFSMYYLEIKVRLMKNKICAIVFLFLLMSFLPSDAQARYVYLNGVPIQHLRNQLFKNVSVKIDSKGNIYITGKNYRVKITNAQPTYPTRPTYRAQPARPSPTYPTRPVRPIRQNRTYPTRTKRPTRVYRPSPTYPTRTKRPTREYRPSPRYPTRSNSSKPSRKYVMVMERSVFRGSGYRLRVFINNRLVKHISIYSRQSIYPITKFLKRGRNKVTVEAYKAVAKSSGHLRFLIAEGSIIQSKVFIQKPYLLKYKLLSTESQNYRNHFYINIR